MSRRDRDRDRDRDRGRERYERDFNTRRYRSGFDREPSPKRSRRDEKLETQKVFSEPNPESGDLTHHSESGHVKTQDAVVPLVSAPRPDSKLESADDKKELEKKPNEQHHADVTPSTNSKEVPRSRTYFQVHLNVSSLGLLEFYWNWLILHAFLVILTFCCISNLATKFISYFPVKVLPEYIVFDQLCWLIFITYWLQSVYLAVSLVLLTFIKIYKFLSLESMPWYPMIGRVSICFLCLFIASTWLHARYKHSGLC